jgi:hypothetical protein
MLTGDPAGRVHAILEPLRAVADEIVVVADARVAAADLGGYAEVADQVLRIEYRMLERHVGWLHTKARGDWILRLDGDEIPSSALLARLPDLLRSRTIDQYCIAQAWLHPDGDHILDDAPWSTDFSNRLVRASASLRFDGRLHNHAVLRGPHAYVEEPVYHLSLAVTDEKQRRAKAIRYEVAQPLKQALGGRFNEAFYLPELRGDLNTRDLAVEDRALIKRALSTQPAPREGADLATVEIVSGGESDRYWEGRSVGAGAYRATIEPYERRHELVAGERRELFFYVTNDGDERWPWGLNQRPTIDLSYHWFNANGSGHIHDGQRSAFGSVVEPGDRVLVPIDVVAPDQPGDYLLEVDVVHEDERWFDCGARVPVHVAATSQLPPAGVRLHPTAAPRSWRRQRRRIPRLIHRIWLGDAEVPADQREYGRGFAAYHRDWEQRLWTDADLAGLGIGAPERARARTASELSNLVRYEVLARHGGVDVDTDVECLRDFSPLLRGIEAFAALELPGRVGTAVLGSVPGQRALMRAARECRATLGTGAHSPDANGPYFFSLLLEQEPSVTILPQSSFYPYRWDEPELAGGPFPDSYAVHRWAGSWLNGTSRGDHLA